METYFVADKYEGYERIGKPFEEEGRLYSKIKIICDRCSHGIYVSHVENGHIVPHPAYGGVCLKCNGAGYMIKTVRLYTEKEKNAATRAKERAAERKVEQRLAAAESKRKEWLEKNGFTSEGITTVYIGSDSYNIKNELKEEGWQYSSLIGWHIGKTNIEDYNIDNLVEVSVENLASFNIYGEGCWLSGAKHFIEQICEQRRPQPKSEWIGINKEKIQNIPVTIKSIRGFDGQFGWTNVITFLNGDNILIWFTSTSPKFAVGESCLLSATIKDHKEYKNEKQTIITRAKLSKEG